MGHFNADEVVAPPAVDPLGFTVGGADFECIPIISAGRARQLRDDMAGGRHALEVVIDFLEDVVTPADRGRFFSRVLDTDDPVDPAKLVAVFVWLCHEYAQRANPDDGTAGFLVDSAPPPPAAPQVDDRAQAERLAAIYRMRGEVGS